MHCLCLSPQRIEEEVDDRRHRMDYLNQAAVLLIQQGSREEAVRVQQELDEFKLFSKQVLDRLDTCRATLRRISAAQVCRSCNKSMQCWDLLYHISPKRQKLKKHLPQNQYVHSVVTLCGCQDMKIQLLTSV